MTTGIELNIISGHSLKRSSFRNAVIQKVKIYQGALVLLLFLSVNVHLSFGQQDKIAQIDSLLAQASELSRQQDTAALTILQEVFELSREADYPLGQVKALNRTGNFYFGMNEMDTAEENYLQGLKLANKIKDSSEIVKIRANLGLVETRRGNYANALEIQLKVVDYYRRNETEKLAGKLVDLGIIYYYLGDQEKLISTLKEGLRIAKEQGDQKIVFTATNNLGIFLSKLGRFKEAEEYFRKTLALAKEQNDLWLQLQAMINIADVIEEPNRALSETKKALILAEQLKALEPKADLLTNMGMLYTTLNQFQKATPYFRQAYKIFEELKISDKQLDVSFRLANNLERTGKYKEAIKYWELHYVLKDSIYKDNMLVKVSKLEKKYEEQKEESKVIEERIEAEKLEAELQRKNRIIIYIILSLIAAVFMFLFFRQRVRFKKKLDNQVPFNSVEINRLLGEIQHALTELKNSSEMGENSHSKDDSGKENEKKRVEIQDRIEDRLNHLKKMFGN
ncbi:MAG: tetratricopeptide repeat protein [Brumimicrobium sp.]|nr:tetratricopeptide repeat protein [Brumimicrobium sp.]